MAIAQTLKTFSIKIDDLRGPEIAALLAEHLECMARVSPKKSRHALDLDGLRRPDITFWTAWEGAELAGGHGEIKSMRTARAFLQRGVATALLKHIEAEARRRGYHRLSLETGAMEYFVPAHRLYHKFGFRTCAPFGAYVEDPNSVFMTLAL